MRMDTKRAWAWAWTGWALATGSSFAYLESAALKKKCHPTLSTTLRRVLGIYPRTRWGKLALVGFAGFWTWLVVHVAHVPDDVL